MHENLNINAFLSNEREQKAEVRTDKRNRCVGETFLMRLRCVNHQTHIKLPSISIENRFCPQLIRF